MKWHVSVRSDSCITKTKCFFPPPNLFSVRQMEAGGKSLHGRESHHHQPLELATGPHLRPGVSYQTADGHLQANSRQQGQRSSSQRFRGHTRCLFCISLTCAVTFASAGVRGAGRRGPKPCVSRWDRGEDRACQHSGERTWCRRRAPLHSVTRFPWRLSDDWSRNELLNYPLGLFVLVVFLAASAP